MFQYLADDQDWPLDMAHLDDDDLTAVTYDWDPEELGIPARQLDDLKRLQQMRPLTANQPWGVFFLEFAGHRLRYTPIRRLLRALVTKKRAAGATSVPRASTFRTPPAWSTTTCTGTRCGSCSASAASTAA